MSPDPKSLHLVHTKP